jgi:hypothetical protein
MALALDWPRGPTRQCGCKGFTMWRDPVERLVSSFNFCRRKSPKKWVPLCGLNTNEAGFRAKTVDAQQANLSRWADNISSYAFRQLLFRPDLFSRIGNVCPPNSSAPGLPMVPAGRRGVGPPKMECRTVHSWTEHRDALGLGGDGVSTPAGREVLRELVEAIGNGMQHPSLPCHTYVTSICDP